MIIQTWLCDAHEKGMAFQYREASRPHEGIGYNNTTYTCLAYDHYACPMGCKITVATRDIPPKTIGDWKTRIKQLKEASP